MDVQQLWLRQICTYRLMLERKLLTILTMLRNFRNKPEIIQNKHWFSFHNQGRKCHRSLFLIYNGISMISNYTLLKDLKMCSQSHHWWLKYFALFKNLCYYLFCTMFNFRHEHRRHLLPHRSHTHFTPHSNQWSKLKDQV